MDNPRPLEWPRTTQRITADEDSLLAWQFFVTFSRMEYALKRSGFIVGPSNRPTADWDEFARQNTEKFNCDTRRPLIEACEYFQSHPPRKQILRDGRLDWSEPQTYSKALGSRFRWLLCMVRRVRNNLFHGGKFPLIHIEEPSKDRLLLKHAQIILEALLKYNATVEHFFLDT